MLTWFLLVSLFCESTQDGIWQENGVLHCGLRNPVLTSSDQMMMLTWEDEPSCAGLDDLLIYELVVLIDKQVHNDTYIVTPDQIGSTHSWNWTSDLALECASVRLRTRYKNYTSPWKQEQTHRGLQNQSEVFPRSRIFNVGSRVTFCCIVPAVRVFIKMFLNDHNESNTNTTVISNQTFALTVDLLLATKKSCTNVICETKTPRGLHHDGACAYIGYPPHDRNMTCQTRDLQSVECNWKVGGDTHISIKSRTVYHLLGRKCLNGSMGSMGSMGSCTVEVPVGAGERNWTLTAQNKLGKVELSDIADLTKRVHMTSPEGMSASAVNAVNATVEWEWTKPQYKNINITCQVKVSNGGANSISHYSGVGLHFADLNNLIPHWSYNVAVRCGTTQHFWRWSDWSTSINFFTKSDVPDALDVWMQVIANQTTIIWKTPAANQSHGNILDYEVTWTQTTEKEARNKTKVQNENRLSLNLDITEEYVVTVTARNRNGSSSPSTIVIPSRKSESGTFPWITGRNGTFNLFWSENPAASCGYIVDWCPTVGYRDVEWLKVPPKETSVRIFSNNFIDGVRYSLSVYACTNGAPLQLKRTEGYVREIAIEDGLFKSLKWKQQNSDVTVSWDSVDIREQPAFIQGYVLYCLSTNRSIRVSTDDPEATSLTARNLDISFHTFTVKAQTAVGECGTTSITASLNSSADNLVAPILISLAVSFILLSLITILCYRHWICIKQKIYPPIPKPVITDKWITSMGEKILPHMDHRYITEANVMDVSELRRTSVAVENDYISPENKLFVLSQASKGCNNHCVKKFTPPTFTFATTIIPAQSDLSSPPFRSKFPNMSYNLIMQTGDQQSNTGPDVPERLPVEEGYQPLSDGETVSVQQPTNDQNAPISCDLTYILLPQSSSN